MKLKALLITAALAFVGCDCPTCPENNQSPDYTVPFCRFGSDHGAESWNCSGTLVDRNATQGLVISANHCTGGTNYHVRFTNGKEYKGVLLASDTQHDLTAIAISRPDVAPIRCGAFTGEGMYYAYGFGGGGQFARVSGKVEETYGPIGSTEHSYIGISGQPIPGDSGAGTVNEQGEFVGVLWGVGNGQGLITAGKPVSDFLRRLVAEGKWKSSATFTPGGKPAYAQTAVPATRMIADSQGRQIEATLCWGRSCPPTCVPKAREIIKYITPAGCPNCPRLPGRNPDGRKPIEDPTEVITANANINVGLLGLRGDAVVVALAIGAACVVLFLRYFRMYDA